MIQSERDIEHYLKRKFEDVSDFRDIRSDVAIDGGRADLVIYKENAPYIIIEVKRQNIDPFSIDVVNQASGYASQCGSNYFATTNGKSFILFKTFEQGVPLMQRKLKVFSVDDEIAKRVLEEISVGVRWLPLDDMFVARLHSLHDILTPSMTKSLKDELSKPSFTKEFEEWIVKQGFPYEKKEQKQKTLGIISKQATYLIINKILFYKILETGYPKLPRLHITGTLNLSKFLRKHFEEALKIDYKAVFEQGIFDEIPVPLDVTESLSKFIKELEGYDFNAIKSDVIGRIYEKLIPPQERKLLGQYYTPPQIVELILKLTVKNPEDKILDPACGSGGFLVKAYHRLLELKKEKVASSQKEHQQILDQIFGVEINQFPAHLSVINLEMQNIKYKSDIIDVIVSDFFDVNNNLLTQPQYKVASLNKEERKTQSYRFFDAVVANPPYIRQEQITHKAKYQQLMKHYGAELDKTSDIYSYFFAHATNFLKNNGRLGFITSNKWLEVKYGESLQKYFLNHHKILAIIEFDAGAFEEVLVNTCVTILEKEKDNKKRDENIVKFVRVKRVMDIDKLVKSIETAKESIENKDIRIILENQDNLKQNIKWNTYLRAPMIYYKLIRNDKLTSLCNIAEINRGITSGSNEFFYLDSKAIKAWGIEKRYLFPLVKTPRDISGIVLKDSNIGSHVLFVRDSKDILKGTNVLEYIKHGEERKINTLPTVKGRKFWYDLGEKRHLL